MRLDAIFIIEIFSSSAHYYSFYVKSIATFALTFFGYIISVLANVNPTQQKSALYLEKQKSWKNSAKCALFSGVRSDLTVPFKSPAQKKLKISEKLFEKQSKCSQLSPLALLSIEKSAKTSKNLKNPNNQLLKLSKVQAC